MDSPSPSSGPSHTRSRHLACVVHPAANLEERKRDLNVTHENILLLRQRLGRAQEGMEDKREYAEKCAQEYDGAKKLKELTDKLDAFEPLLGWAMVTERENELKRVEAQAAQAAQAEAEAKKEAEAAHEDQREQEDRVAELERRYAKTGNDIQSHAVKGQRAKEQATGAQKQVKRAKKQMAEVTESLRMAELEAAAADDDYNNHLSMMESTKDSKQVKQMRRVHQLHQKIGTDEQAEAELQQVVEEKKQTYSDAIETSRKAEGEAKEAQREEKAKEAAHKEAQRAGFDKLAQLHPDMSQLLDLLKKHAKDFASPPLGPIGAHIAVQSKHATLGAAVELAIHPNNLCSFIVFSKADEMKLHDLLKKVKPKQNVMPLRDLARVAWRSVEPRFTLKQSGQRAANAPVRLIDAVDVTAPGADGDAFYNFLLDSCSAEHKLVFDNVQEAQRVVWSSRERFAEAIACPGYSQPARKVLKRNETTGSEPLHGNRNMLARDKKAAVESSRAEAATAKEEASRCARRFKEADTLRKQVFEEEKAARKQLSDVTNRLTATREEYDRLSGESVSDAVALEVDAARQTAQRAREDIERFRRELEAASTSHEDAEKAFQPLRERLGSFGDKYDELMSQSKALEAELDEARAPLTKSKTRQSALRKTLAAARAAQEESEKKAADMTNNLAMLMPQVQSIYGDRVHDQHKPARSVAVLQEEKRQLEAKIKREEQKHGGKQLTRLAEEAAKAKKMHDEAKSDLDNVVSMEVKEAAMLKERHKFFKKECKGKGYQAANDFNNRLSRKGHAGSLTFDHDHETLSLTVSRNSQDENSASTADARNLSGGERSFTTLSFEIAMCAFDKLEPNPREALTKSLQAGRLTRCAHVRCLKGGNFARRPSEYSMSSTSTWITRTSSRQSTRSWSFATRRLNASSSS